MRQAAELYRVATAGEPGGNREALEQCEGHASPWRAPKGFAINGLPAAYTGGKPSIS